MPGVQNLTPATLEDQLQRVAVQLGSKYSDRAEASEVTAAVYEEAARFTGAKVTQYIPVLVQHKVQERFRRRGPNVLATAVA